MHLLDLSLHTFRNRGAALLIAVCTAVFAGSCGLIPTEEKEHKLNIVTEDVSSRYDLAMAQLADVELTKTIVCTYSQLNEIKVYFSIGGYKVNSIYVSEGDRVSAGDPLAALDMSAQEQAIISFGEQIRSAQLEISQNEEMIDFYQKRIDSAGVSLLDKEDYALKSQECEENINRCQKTIEYAEKRTEEYKALIEQSVVYSEIDGTVYFVRDDLSGSTSNPETFIMKILDSSECAFTAEDKAACPYLKVGDPVLIERSTGESYAASVTSIDPESGKMVFDLDEPDFSISVGTRANINLLVDSREQVLAIPRIALYGNEDEHYVYVLTEDGVREPVTVEVGLIGNTNAEILSGIEIYTSVIVR